ncbi:MAG: M28 family peptidase [Legionella sp.]
MSFNNWMTGFSMGCFLISGAVFANNIPQHQQVQLPLCLADTITFDHHVLAENKQYKIIDMLASDINKLALLADKVHCGRFMNVSHKVVGNALSAQKLLQEQPKNFVSEVYQIQHSNLVNPLLAEVNSQNIWSTLTELTSFYNRSASKETGVKTANWLKEHFDALAKEYNRTDTNSYFVKTGWYKQPSLVTVIGADKNAPALVIGAHMDTLDGRMPGAGDDGSGSSSVMEMARVLMASDVDLNRPVYIIWYAAEEVGLVGSQFVVKYFKEHKIPVKAAIQFDMTGFRPISTDPTMWVYTDFVNPDLSTFVEDLIKTYVQVPVGHSACGYACSDHASWNEAGIPAAFPCESSFVDVNPNIHSSRDTMNFLSLEHMTNFTKLGLAFAVELAVD